MSDFIDRPREIREGEGLDIGRLTTYLKEHVPELSGVSSITVKQFQIGHSNLTY